MVTPSSANGSAASDPAATGPAATDTEAEEASALVPRAAERTRVRLTGRLREQGRTAIEVEVHDLSLHGFKVNTVYRLRPGALVWLQMADLGPLAARVRWFRDFRIGCAFETPLHRSVLNHIVSSALPD